MDLVAQIERTNDISGKESDKEASHKQYQLEQLVA
jgi:hypothetical protein